MKSKQKKKLVIEKFKLKNSKKKNYHSMTTENASGEDTSLFVCI